ncbi:MAG: macro domain-containing protein [Clostridia bacterium]|nr:macro domain-containing protein [Clostridia bacterium]
MPFYLLHEDITRVKADAVVNAANPSLLGGGGVDGAIHRAAGPELREECAALGGCRPGEAKKTAAYRLPAKYVIHTVGPIWEGGNAGEREILGRCYKNSLALARDIGCESVVFPLISAGAYGYPREEALAAAVEEIRAFLDDGNDDMTVTLALFDDPARMRKGFPLLGRMLEGLNVPRPAADFAPAAPGAAPKKRKADLLSFAKREKARGNLAGALSLRKEEAPAAKEAFEDAELPSMAQAAPAFGNASSLEEALSMIDESFSEMLLRKIDERGMKDSECYRRANVDRKLFSKIRSDRRYRPSKATALAFAVALELSLPETEELLLKAGYALSPSAPFDVIVRFFIERGKYDLFEINEALYAFDQKQLGA